MTLGNGKQNKLRKLGKLAFNPAVTLGRYEKLFLISHMRARTSLLSHIFGSHPEVSGYYEQHIEHRKWASDWRLRVSLLEEGLFSKQTRYLYDKVLHDHLDPAPDAACARVVMLREPKATLKSIVQMGKSRDTKWQDEELAESYYCNRLEEIAVHVEQCVGKVALLDSQDMVDDDSAVLQSLSDFLGLKTPLHSGYDSFARTGKAVSGDPSQSIQAGAILKEGRRHDVTISSALLERAMARHHNVTERLRRIDRVSAIR